MKPVIIKRYNNRKLYRQDDSSYANLSDLRELVASRTPFKVISYSSPTHGQDITKQMLISLLTQVQRKKYLENSEEEIANLIRSA